MTTKKKTTTTKPTHDLEAAREAGYHTACQELIDWCEEHLAHLPKDHPDTNAANYAYRAAVNRIRDVARVMLALPETTVTVVREPSE